MRDGSGGGDGEIGGAGGGSLGRFGGQGHQVDNVDNDNHNWYHFHYHINMIWAGLEERVTRWTVDDLQSVLTLQVPTTKPNMHQSKRKAIFFSLNFCRGIHWKGGGSDGGRQCRSYIFSMKKLQHNFLKMRGEGSKAVWIFSRKFIRFGSLTRLYTKS